MPATTSASAQMPGSAGTATIHHASDKPANDRLRLNLNDVRDGTP